MRRLAPVLLLALLALAAACGGGGGDATSSPTRKASPTASHSSSRTPTATAANASGSPTSTVTPRSTQQPVFVTPSASPTPVPTANPNAPLYIALGDSLSYGNGASDRNATAWVPIVKQTLGWGLANLGVPGYTSADLLNKGEISQAIALISARKTDGIPGNEVGAITLEIGGNDLLNLYFDLVVPGTCPSVTESLQIPECVDGLRNALTHFTPNLEQAVTDLQQAAPGVPIFLATLYNPFSGGAQNLDGIGALALEGQEGTPFATGLNDAVRAVAQEKGVHVVEWYGLFIGKVNEYISDDIIHPNDEGQQVMAQAVLQAMALAGVQ